MENETQDSINIFICDDGPESLFLPNLLTRQSVIQAGLLPPNSLTSLDRLSLLKQELSSEANASVAFLESLNDAPASAATKPGSKSKKPVNKFELMNAAHNAQMQTRTNKTNGSKTKHGIAAAAPPKSPRSNLLLSKLGKWSEDKEKIRKEMADIKEREEEEQRRKDIQKQEEMLRIAQENKRKEEEERLKNEKEVENQRV